MAESGGRRGEAREFAITAIVTSYYEEKSIDEFYARLSRALEDSGRSYEIIMVNDGSTDKTFERHKAIYEKDENVSTIIDFFKNSGQLSAWTAAICESRGEAVLLIDSDMQMDPANLPRLLAEYDKGYDLVSGYRKDRKDSFTRILPSKIANAIMRKASGSTLRDFGCTFKLYKGKLLRGMDFGPFNTFNTSLVVAQVQHYTEAAIDHAPRKYGKSGWTFRKLWQFNMDNLVNLSLRPFQYLAFGCLALACLLLIRVSFGFLTEFRVLDEVTNGLLLNALALVLVMVLAVLSLIGEFVIRIFMMVQHTPAYIIREIHRR